MGENCIAYFHRIKFENVVLIIANQGVLKAIFCSFCLFKEMRRRSKKRSHLAWVLVGVSKEPQPLPLHPMTARLPWMPWLCAAPGLKGELAPCHQYFWSPPPGIGRSWRCTKYAVKMASLAWRPFATHNRRYRRYTMKLEIKAERWRRLLRHLHSELPFCSSVRYVFVLLLKCWVFCFAQWEMESSLMLFMEKGSICCMETWTWFDFYGYHLRSVSKW